MLEIELKVGVNALEPVRTRLEERNARFCGKVHEHDIYYNAPHRDFGATDEALRVRYIDQKAIVTYKGAKIKKYGLKAREELNTAIESGEVFEQMLQRLGFVKVTEINKWRENYCLGNAAISLDEVKDLGTFVEIEVIAENAGSESAAQIKKLAKEIGVEGEPILTSYLELLLAKRTEARF